MRGVPSVSCQIEQAKDDFCNIFWVSVLFHSTLIRIQATGEELGQWRHPNSYTSYTRTNVCTRPMNTV